MKKVVAPQTCFGTQSIVKFVQDDSEVHLLFLLITDQFIIVGGDQTPTLCKNEGEGTVFKMSFLTIAKVTSVMPRSGFRNQYCPLKRTYRTLHSFGGVETLKVCLRTQELIQ